MLSSSAWAAWICLRRSEFDAVSGAAWNEPMTSS